MTDDAEHAVHIECAGAPASAGNVVYVCRTCEALARLTHSMYTAVDRNTYAISQSPIAENGD